MMKQQLKGSILLLLATVIWGCAFVAQSVGMDYLGPFTFQTCRSLIAVAALVAVIFLMERDKSQFVPKWRNKKLWNTGLLCGAALTVASGLQQMGLVYTDAGKAGFITAMYIVLVPALGLFLGQKPGRQIWISVGLAVVGLYLLSCAGASGLNIGDVMLMGCALAFAVQITLIDRFAQDLDGLRLNCIQFLVVSVLSAVVMLLTEAPDWSSILACAIPLLYTGVLSSAVGYSLQIIGQQLLPPAPASLIMSLESVFAVLSGWLVLKERLSPPELIGCALVFAGVILSQTKNSAA